MTSATERQAHLPISDDKLWDAVREAAAELGWQDRGTVLQRAHLRLLRKHEWPTGSFGLMQRLERLWDQKMIVREAN